MLAAKPKPGVPNRNCTLLQGYPSRGKAKKNSFALWLKKGPPMAVCTKIYPNSYGLPGELF